MNTQFQSQSQGGQSQGGQSQGRQSQEDGLQRQSSRSGQDGVWLSVRHETRYEYGVRVDVAHHLAALTPREESYQRLGRFRISIDPPPAQVHPWVDSFGNRRTGFALFAPHRHLKVVASSVVFRATPKGGDGSFTPAGPRWPQVRQLLRYAQGQPYHAEAEFTFGTTLAPSADALRDYARPSFTPERTVHQAAVDFMRRVHEDFRYVPQATGVGTPATESLRLRQGVCQDFSHVMIGGLRSLGLAARYVSGYLRTIPTQGAVPLTGADASHAWVSVYCPAGGWLDLDPTNNLIPALDHVTLAWGRDYADVAPLRGVIRGGGAHSLHVGVQVSPAEDPGSP